MAIDDAFDGFDHDSLPSVALDFSCKTERESTQPEAVVDIKNDGQWVRIPITSVETRINKDGPADLTYTSRVDVPVTWGQTPDGEEKIPIYEYVGAANKEENAEFDVARVAYWNQYTERYQIQQFGYVATIGPSTENGVFRFYIYDTSDLMQNISVTKTYDGPTAENVAQFVAYDGDYGVEANTPINVEAVSTTAPGERREVVGAYEGTAEDVAGWLNDTVPILKFAEGDDDAINPFREFVDDALHTGGHKHFRRNRHTLVDVMEWLTDEVGGAWYFEPRAEGVVLVVNNGVSDDFAIARTSYYDGQVDPDDVDYTIGNNHIPIDVVNNSSLEDLKPINHLELNGESADSFFGINTDRTILGGPLGAPRGQTDKYPHIEVTYPPLLERAGDRKLGPPPIESDKTTLAEARQKAVKEFKKEHEDSTDGSVEVRAIPSIRPYDYLTAVPVCNDTFDADMLPIQYEINTVVHSVKADEPYMSSLGVSIALDEAALDVESSFLEVDLND